jgi:hypothetical protein
MSGGWKPTARVYLGGVLVALGPDVDGSIDPHAPVGIDTVWADWGRERAIENPDSPAGGLTLLVPDPSWVAAREKTLIGTSVGLSYVYPDGSAEWFYFRGKIAGARLTRQRVKAGGAWVDGVRLECTLASDLNELANRMVSGTWASESIPALRSRLLTLASPLLTDIQTSTFWHPEAAVIDRTVDDVSVLDLLYELFEQGAARMVYDPHARTVQPSRRHWYDLPNALRLTEVGGQITVRPITPTVPFTWSAVTVPAGYLADFADEPLQRDLASGVTRVQTHVRRPEGGGVPDYWFVAPVPGADEVSYGIRAMKVTSIMYSVSWGQEVGEKFAEYAGREGNTWRLPPLVWDTGRTDGFDDVVQAFTFLRGYETYALVALTGSWLPAVGVRPLFGIIGGRITYTGGRWITESQTVPVGLGQTQTALRWSEFTTDPAKTWADVDPALTWADLAYIGRGHGMTADAPR